jgi:hypothetical protein
MPKILEKCINQPRVLSELKPALSDERGEFIPLVARVPMPDELNIFAAGVPVFLSNEKDLFFYGIQDFIEVLEMTENKKSIDLEFKVKSHFGCTYNLKRNGVKKLRVTP